MEDEGKEVLILYRCDGGKCGREDGFPTCFYTSDKEYADPMYEPKIVDGEMSQDDIVAWLDESYELEEYQASLPVEKRMQCKRSLPIVTGAKPDAALEQGG